MTYREQSFVERCFCEAPAIGPCECCGRARCASHLERRLCNRCGEAVERDMVATRETSWMVGVAATVAVTLGLLAFGVIGSIFAGIPLGVLAGVARHRRHRKRTIKLLGPKLAAFKGELPEPSREREVGNSGSQSFGGPGNYC